MTENQQIYYGCLVITLVIQAITSTILIKINDKDLKDALSASLFVLIVGFIPLANVVTALLSIGLLLIAIIVLLVFAAKKGANYLMKDWDDD